jgi:Domain of unknown function (DUF4823)
MPSIGRALTAVTTLAAAACAHTVTKPLQLRDELLTGRIFVMQAVGAQHTVTDRGRTFQKVQGFPSFAGEYISLRVLEVVQQRHPGAEVVDVPFLEQAMKSALDRGATYLIVPQVDDWYDAETQYTGVRDRIALELRLVRIRPRATIASVTFKRKSGVLAIHDRPPTHLLDDSFGTAIRRLLGDG